MSDSEIMSSVFDTTIPISHNSSPDSPPSRKPNMVPNIEKQMDKEVEQVFREWDENVKCRKQNSFQVRPTKSLTSADKRRRRFPNDMSKSMDATPNQSKRFEFPEIGVIRREDSSFNTSTDSLEDDARRQYYMESPTTGQRLYHMEFDVNGYDQQNITVKVSGNRLVVHAVQQQTDSGRKSTTEFCRKVKLPSDVEVNKLTCTCSKGRLVVEAPAPKPPSTSTGTPTFSVNSPIIEPLNQPIYKSSPRGKTMHLTVDLCRVFRAEDVLVKVKSQNKLSIHAQREETHVKSKMASTMTREFDLDEKIIPQSLKAGLTVEGLLKVSAQVLVEVRVITNGIDEEENDINHDTKDMKVDT